jgi:hypothetical protein
MTCCRFLTTLAPERRSCQAYQWALLETILILLRIRWPLKIKRHYHQRNSRCY